MSSDNKWQELLIGHLYGELDADEERRLREGLAASAELRAELERLREARRVLGEARPAVPSSPSRVVVFSTPPLRRPLLAFAAGFACAAVLLAVGATAGWSFATRTGTATPLRAVPVADSSIAEHNARPVTEAELHDALSAYQGRLDRVNQENQELRQLLEQQTGRPVLTRDQFDSELLQFVRTLDARRASDLNYILGELADMQVRTDTRIGRTQEALRYVMLSGDPSLSEQ